MFNAITESIIHFIFFAGVVSTVAGFLLGRITYFKTEKLPIQIIGFALLALGLYLEGGLAKKKDYEAKVQELEAKVARAEVEAAKRTVEVQEKVVEKVKIVKEKGEKQIEYITKVEKGDTITIVKDMSPEERKKFQDEIDALKKFNAQCQVPSIVINEINKAAQKPEGDKK